MDHFHFQIKILQGCSLGCKLLTGGLLKDSWSPEEIGVVGDYEDDDDNDKNEENSSSSHSDSPTATLNLNSLAMLGRSRV